MIFDLAKCAEKTGKSEVDIAKSIIKAIIFKADYYQQDQTIILSVKGDGDERESILPGWKMPVV